MSTYCRRRDGLVIHKTGCRYTERAVPWNWAEGLSEFEVGSVAVAYDYRICGLCFGRPAERRTAEAANQGWARRLP